MFVPEGYKLGVVEVNCAGVAEENCKRKGGGPEGRGQSVVEHHQKGTTPIELPALDIQPTERGQTTRDEVLDVGQGTCKERHAEINRLYFFPGR